ncbi:hypothetical protein ACFXCZ_27295 [Streptomyces sp. NPDC059396]|uniref:hypothetical protein n=1 Tax=Streptomyces sp. NPDC059396 TaxID=3346819 RepID=UPI0036B0DF02
MSAALAHQRPEPPRAAAGARPRAGSGVRANRPGRRAEQLVWIPESLYRGPHFNDEATAVYAKVAALDARRSYPGAKGYDTDPCTASVSELAIAIGVSKSVAERGLRPLNQPGPDGAEPWLGTRRRTHRGGTGRTAERYARLVPAAESALQIPVRVAEALTPRQLRAWLHLLRATTAGTPVTGAELAGELYHHTGKNAGAPLGERTGRRIMTELDRLGWITLTHRAGRQGRHLVTVHTTPLRVVRTAPALDPACGEAEQLAFEFEPEAGPDIHDGSGADDLDGSLASEEDSKSSTDVSSQLTRGIRRRRGAGSTAVDTPRGEVPAAFGRGDRGLRPDRAPHPSAPPVRPPYTGPGLQLSPRVWAVLEPVRHELPAIRPYLLRRIAHAVGRQLDAGTAPQRLTARLTHRYATTRTIRDPGRWILGAGLVRHGCGLDVCESGVIWHTGHRCQTCLANTLHQAQQAARQQEPQAPAPVPPPHTPRPAPAGADDPDRWAPGRAPRPDSGAPVLTRRQKAALRAAATPDSVRAAIRQYGQADATDLYGHALVLPLITGSEGDAHVCAQAQ